VSEGAARQLALFFDTQPSPARVWTDYFDQRRAVEAVSAYVATLPSSRTEEQHTRVAYAGGLKHFLAWAGNELPTTDLMRQYVAFHVQRGLRSRTIISRYLAPIRHYLKRLADQIQPGLKGDERDFVADCREQIRQASAIEYPRVEITSDVPPLWRAEFKRLTIEQVNTLLRSIDRDTLAGLRDYALLHLAFSTGLRLAELARVSLSSIRVLDSATYTVSVRGKRNNIDPVPLMEACYEDIRAYTTAFNASLPETDSALRIDGDVPVWKALTKYGTPLVIVGRDPRKGLSHQAIRDIVGGRSLAALGEEWRLAVHDTRRTCAFLAHESGMDLDDVRALLRHKDISITMKYIGQKPDLSKRALGKRVNFG
jgi:site-specific recombinase XerD